MTQLHYRIRGIARDVEALLRPTGEVANLRHARRLTPAQAREVAGELEVASDEIVRVELENGFVLWSRADDFVRGYGRSTLSRDGAQAWDFDRLLPRRARSAGTRGERGAAGLVIRTLEFLGVDLAEFTASKLSVWTEDKQLKDRPPGFYRCPLDDSFDLKPVDEDRPIPAGEGPILVFIHGTSSSTEGSFGKLWAEKNLEGKKARDVLKNRYGDRVFALQHRTLSESPVTNALALLKCVPKGAELHLVSHSRGGLVGELLCLSGCRNLTQALSAQRLRVLFAADRVMAEQIGLSPLDEDARKERDKSYEHDRQKLAELIDEFKSRQIRVARFVRVACPARGTTLASGRLDRWFSVLNFLAEKTAGDGLFKDALDFLLAVAKKRTDPRTLPGLEAMMPGSALTRLLQHPDLVTSADLSVIAGDIEGDSLWSQIKLLAADWFYSAEHDLVVNTGSMFGGLPRTEKGARSLCDKGPVVNHFSYFSNDRSVRWLLAGLTRNEGADGGFQPIGEAKHEEPRWREAVRRSRAAAAPRPLAVVLPGIMGSKINVRGDNVWLDYPAIMFGQLDRLRLDSKDVEATGVLDDFYGPLLEFLSISHRVEIFPYDWRHSVVDAAESLADRLTEWLPEAEGNRQPVHIVAHSMGGLVVRAMIADRQYSQLWRRCLAHKNSRLLMLGTPNLGSYEAVRWLTGFNPTEAKLELLDFAHDMNEIIDIVRNFPGLLELLPLDGESPDFAQQALWKKLKQELSAPWNTPDDKPLRQARSVWSRLKEAAPAPERMIYVAGCQDMTVAGYQLIEDDSPLSDRRKRLQFLGVREGDGTVTWKSGLLPGVPTWYVEDTAHGDLCTRRRAFPGYLDLLMTGATTRLPNVPPGPARAAGVEPEKFLMPIIPPTDDIPDERAFRSIGFGPGRPFTIADEGPVAPVIQLSVTHGDLTYAKHPVLVGHYQGDTILNAEQALDNRLDGALSRRLRLGLYPGRAGTHALFFNEDKRSKPGGAVVVGLGQVGELSPTLLESGVRDALLEFALQVASCHDDRFGAAGSVRSAAVSCLLIGSGPGGVSVRDSIESILRGAARANDRLARVDLIGKVLIDRIEFVELFEDMALTAAEALQRLLADGEFAAAANWKDCIIDEGQGRLYRPRGDEAPGWWHRLEIVEDKIDERTVGLRFIASTDRARAEVTQAVGQLRLADSFIQEASSSTATNAEVAKTLFEMLLPNQLKELAPRQTDLVLLVDEASARYPWELLEDRWSLNDRPAGVTVGLVRQLKTPQFRPRPAHASAPSAFVVGNPDLQGWELFPDLPGARREAQVVAGLLRGHGYRVTDCIGEAAQSVIKGLHGEAWRILHLAGHGEHEFLLEMNRASGLGAAPDEAAQSCKSAERVSGMVIGKGVFLAPGDVEQMRWTPELVFINCCHLGRTQAERRPRYSELAANLGVQFINMGVKAVIASGWAVDDGAATAFAECFYARMLSGESFGEAARAAREEIWVRFPDVNTWGAYQCYGDPGFQLFDDGSALLKRNGGRYHSPSELVADLNNHAERIRVRINDIRSADALREMRDEIVHFLERIPDGKRDEWLRRGDVTSAIGLAWGETGAWAQAVDWLEKALASAKSNCPIRVVEQCANFRSRLAAEQWGALRVRAPADIESQRGKLVETIDKAIHELEILSEWGKTEERMSLLGGAHKRLALLHSEPARRQGALLNAAKYYRAAFEIGGRAKAYAFTNWATASLLAAHMGAAVAGVEQPDLEAETVQLKQALAKSAEERPVFWDYAAIADIDLVRLIGAGTNESCAALADAVIDGYQRAISRGASPREIGSLMDNLELVIELVAETPSPLRDALDRIHNALSTTGAHASNCGDAS